jgi:hypothetical protein
MCILCDLAKTKILASVVQNDLIPIQQLPSPKYYLIDRTTEGATQNSLAGEHGYNDEVAANREIIG